MKAADNIPVQAPASAVSIYRALVGVGCMCGLIIVSVFLLTGPAIEKNRVETMKRALLNVLPLATSQRAFGLEGAELVELTEQAEAQVFTGYDAEGQLVGFAVMASGRGYQDVIKVIYGYSPQKQSIIGLQVLESRETPGLGDKIETEKHFTDNFVQLDVSMTADAKAILHPVVAVKQGQKTQPWQIDGITGATVSSEAIASILRQSTERWVPLLHQNRHAFRSPAGGINGQ